MLNKELAQNFVSELSLVIGAATGTDASDIDMSGVLLALTGPDPVTAGVLEPDVGLSTVRGGVIVYNQ
ncbi:hypothetical protein [Agrobacterium vaccinii]|uniref:hypothetical protein n=1 Tax=Agrobacterium vaccinii TaxID=2735528 RepID=UPI001E2D61F8|nr:hypothetical protein [Agrobacterium vaccinii]UHS55509.1 hypothetical protein HRS00_01065 [Agrobacterium vaccinii]